MRLRKLGSWEAGFEGEDVYIEEYKFANAMAWVSGMLLQYLLLLQCSFSRYRCLGT